MQALKRRWQSGIGGKLLVLGVILFACVACGVLGSALQGPDEATEVATTAPKVTATTVASRCVPASAQQLERVQAGVTGLDARNEVREAWAVESKDFANVWMVAALIYGPGAENGVGPGVWAVSGDPDKTGLTLAVDGFAKEFSDYPDASKTDAAIDGNEDGIVEAKACVK